MRLSGYVLAALSALAIAIMPARAVELDAQKPLAKDLAAFPRLKAAPDDKNAARINQALTQADKRALSGLAECRGNAGKDDVDWERSIAVTMRGPRLVSYVARSSWMCGGPHPDNDAIALVYDLNTGAPVDWSRFLPKALLGKVAIDTAGDDTRLGTLASPLLHRLYAKWMHDPDCRDAVSDPSFHFMIWPDAAKPGLAVEPVGMSHAVAPCIDTMVLGMAQLKQIGVQQNLLDALTQAHDQGLFDRQP